MQELKKKELEDLDAVFAELGIAVESKGAAAAADAAGEGKKKKKNKKKEGEGEGAAAAAKEATEEPSEEPSEDPADESAGPVDPAAVSIWGCIHPAVGAAGGFLAPFVGLWGGVGRELAGSLAPTGAQQYVHTGGFSIFHSRIRIYYAYWRRGVGGGRSLHGVLGARRTPMGTMWNTPKSSTTARLRH